MSDLQEIRMIRCGNCAMEIDHFQNPPQFDGERFICGRCAKPLDFSEVQTKELATHVDHLNQAGEREFQDLMMMLDNWAQSYIRIVEQGTVDWSMPHELFEEFTLQMCPYIIRLRETGYSTPERLRAIGTQTVSVIKQLINTLQTEEDLLRLGGNWTDQDQEIKDYWTKKGELLNANLRISLS